MAPKVGSVSKRLVVNLKDNIVDFVSIFNIGTNSNIISDDNSGIMDITDDIAVGTDIKDAYEIDDIMTIAKQLPKERQTMLFSATMPQEIRKLAVVWQWS